MSDKPPREIPGSYVDRGGGFTFYLGTHQPCFLAQTSVPLFISVQRFRRYLARKRVNLHKALGPWALDSGGFSELSKFDRWQTSAGQYSAEVSILSKSVGQLRFAAIQDWMCEPFMVRKTGLSIAEHQRRTVDSYYELLSLEPALPWMPVLQGWTGDDYLRCADLYQAQGFNLSLAPVVGVGSMCRRQGTKEATAIMRRLSELGLPLHALGFKTLGLPSTVGFLASSDSLAWSKQARSNPHQRLAECEGKHQTCSNCMRYALRWRERVLDCAHSLPASLPFPKEAR